MFGNSLIASGKILNLMELCCLSCKLAFGARWVGAGGVLAMEALIAHRSTMGAITPSDLVGASNHVVHFWRKKPILSRLIKWVVELTYGFISEAASESGLRTRENTGIYQLISKPRQRCKEIYALSTLLSIGQPRGKE